MKMHLYCKFSRVEDGETCFRHRKGETFPNLTKSATLIDISPLDAYITNDTEPKMRRSRRGGSRKSFHKTAKRSHPKNKTRLVMRGGTRL
nr:MAG: hypothetical protein [Microvirus sp.]